MPRNLKLAFGAFWGLVAGGLVAWQSSRVWFGLPVEEAIGGYLIALIPAFICALVLYGVFIDPRGLSKVGPAYGPNAVIARHLSDSRRPENRRSTDVVVVFHTYAGFLLFFTQIEWRFALPPDEARRVLWVMHRSNLTWGAFAKGALFIPILSLASYLGQLRSIRRQEEEMEGSDAGIDGE